MGLWQQGHAGLASKTMAVRRFLRWDKMASQRDLRCIQNQEH
jgi:hypothetical protein